MKQIFIIPHPLVKEGQEVQKWRVYTQLAYFQGLRCCKMSYLGFGYVLFTLTAFLIIGIREATSKLQVISRFWLKENKKKLSTFL